MRRSFRDNANSSLLFSGSARPEFHRVAAAVKRLASLIHKYR
jgi:hypothetical protein